MFSIRTDFEIPTSVRPQISPSTLEGEQVVLGTTSVYSKVPISIPKPTKWASHLVTKSHFQIHIFNSGKGQNLTQDSSTKWIPIRTTSLPATRHRNLSYEWPHVDEIPTVIKGNYKGYSDSWATIFDDYDFNTDFEDDNSSATSAPASASSSNNSTPLSGRSRSNSMTSNSSQTSIATSISNSSRCSSTWSHGELKAIWTEPKVNSVSGGENNGNKDDYESARLWEEMFARVHRA